MRNSFNNVTFEKIAEFDDIFLDKYLQLIEEKSINNNNNNNNNINDNNNYYNNDNIDNNSEFSKEDVINALTRISRSRSDNAIFVILGSSIKDVGIENVLNGIVDILPPPEKYSANETFQALAFKVVFDVKRNGFLVYCRVYRGNFNPKRSATLYNANKKGKREQVSRVMQVMADELVEINETGQGEVVILLGLKFTATGDTLTNCENEIISDINSHNTSTNTNISTRTNTNTNTSKNILLKGINVPSPVICVSLEAESPGDQDHLEKCLEIIQLEDPSARVKIDNSTGQTILSGMGELHLEILALRLRKDFKAKFKIGPIIIAFKESLIFPGVFKTRHVIDRDIYGIKLKGSVDISLTLTEESEFKVEFKDNFHDQSVIKAVEDAVSGAFGCGPISGFPVIKNNCHILIENLEFSANNSAHVVVFEALQIIFKEAASNKQMVILEPVVKVEIDTPEEFIGDLTGDLFGSRDCVGCECLDNGRIWARVPLRKMLGYSTWLRSRTGGLASFTMESDGHCIYNNRSYQG